MISESQNVEKEGLRTGFLYSTWNKWESSQSSQDRHRLTAYSLWKLIVLLWQFTRSANMDRIVRLIIQYQCRCPVIQMYGHVFKC